MVDITIADMDRFISSKICNCVRIRKEYMSQLLSPNLEPERCRFFSKRFAYSTADVISDIAYCFKPLSKLNLLSAKPMELSVAAVGIPVPPSLPDALAAVPVGW